MALFKNYGELDQILTGNDPIRFMPGQVVDIDPERLKVYAPEDVANIRPYVPEAPAPLVESAPASATEDEQASADLLALLRDVNSKPTE